MLGYTFLKVIELKGSIKSYITQVKIFLEGMALKLSKKKVMTIKWTQNYDTCSVFIPDLFHFHTSKILLTQYWKVLELSLLISILKPLRPI